jgi:hypothetical protein
MKIVREEVILFHILDYHLRIPKIVLSEKPRRESEDTVERCLSFEGPIVFT